MTSGGKRGVSSISIWLSLLEHNLKIKVYSDMLLFVVVFVVVLRIQMMIQQRIDRIDKMYIDI